MKRIIWLILIWGMLPVSVLMAQTTVPLKYQKEIPKNLYAARYAVLINYISNKNISPAEEEQKTSEIIGKLQTANQQLGVQLVHFANKSALQQPARSARIFKQYDSLKVNNLFILDVTDFKDQGAEESYVLLLTGYNRTPKLMSANQIAFTLQAESFEKLVRILRAEIDQYKPAYFLKPAAGTAPKTTVAANTSQTPAKTPVKKAEQPYKFPIISLTEEDAKRTYGGPHDNFYYYMGTNLQEKNAGFFGQKLRNDLEASPDAVKELNKYRNLKYMYLAERGLFITSLALYAEYVASQDERRYFDPPQRIYIGMAIGSLMINHILSRTTNKHMFRAIDEYNTFATMKNNTGFRLTKPDNYGLGYIQGTVPSAGLSATWNIR